MFGNFGAPNTNTFGTFGQPPANNQPAPFGQTPNFNAPGANTFGGTFPATNPGFGATNQAPSNNFGNFGTFGSTPAATTSIFGGTANTAPGIGLNTGGGLTMGGNTTPFGGNTTNTFGTSNLFGTNPSNPGFGQPTSQPSGMFGGTPNPSQPGFGFNQGNVSSFSNVVGTGNPPFKGITEKDPSAGTLTFNTITAMNEYQHKSIDELRWEDYQKKKTGGGNFGMGVGGNMFGGTTAPTSNLFGSAPGTPFGGTTPTPLSSVGTSTGPLFSGGATNTTLGSPFGGAPNPTASPFGQPSGGLFGANTGTGLNLGTGATGGSTLGGNLFGGQNATSTTTGTAPFGGTGLFGGAPATNSPFGAPAATGGGLFGAGGMPSTGGLFGNTTGMGSTLGAPASSSPFGNTTGGGGLFGNTASAAPTFGGITSQPPSGTPGFGGGLFGTAPAGQPNSGFNPSGTGTSSLFGNTASSPGFGTTAATPGGSLFGGASTLTGGTPGSTLFGGNTTAASPSLTSGGGLFGTAATPTTGGLFGTSSLTGGASPASSTLFGGTGTANTLFGSTAAPSGGLFGATSQPTGGSSLFPSFPGSTVGGTTGLFGPATPLTAATRTASLQTAPYGSQLLAPNATDLSPISASIGGGAAPSQGDSGATPSSASSSALSMALRNKLTPKSVTKAKTTASKLLYDQFLTDAKLPSPATPLPTSLTGAPGSGSHSSLLASHVSPGRLDSVILSPVRPSSAASSLSSTSLLLSNTPNTLATPSGLLRTGGGLDDSALLASPYGMGQPAATSALNLQTLSSRKNPKKLTIPKLIAQELEAKSTDETLLASLTAKGDTSAAKPPRPTGVSPSTQITVTPPTPVAARGVSSVVEAAAAPSSDLYTKPALTDLGNHTLVPNFVVGRKGFGSIKFLKPVSVKGVTLEYLQSIVKFDRAAVEVYPDEKNKDPPGSGFNQEALITLEQVWPLDPKTKRPNLDSAAVTAFRTKLTKMCAKMEAEFISYDPSSGEWLFKVAHFSRYGLLDDDEEDESQLVVDSKLNQTRPVVLPKPLLAPRVRINDTNHLKEEEQQQQPGEGTETKQAIMMGEEEEEEEEVEHFVDDVEQPDEEEAGELHDEYAESDQPPGSSTVPQRLVGGGGSLFDQYRFYNQQNYMFDQPNQLESSIKSPYPYLLPSLYYPSAAPSPYPGIPTLTPTTTTTLPYDLEAISSAAEAEEEDEQIDEGEVVEAKAVEEEEVGEQHFPPVELTPPLPLLCLHLPPIATEVVVRVNTNSTQSSSRALTTLLRRPCGVTWGPAGMFVRLQGTGQSCETQRQLSVMQLQAGAHDSGNVHLALLRHHLEHYSLLDQAPASSLLPLSSASSSLLASLPGAAGMIKKEVTTATTTTNTQGEYRHLVSPPLPQSASRKKGVVYARIEELLDRYLQTAEQHFVQAKQTAANAHAVSLDGYGADNFVGLVYSVLGLVDALWGFKNGVLNEVNTEQAVSGLQKQALEPVCRKVAFSRWLSSCTTALVKTDLTATAETHKEAETRMERFFRQLLVLLTGKQSKAAVQWSVQHAQLGLAAVLAQGTHLSGTRSEKLQKELLRNWCNEQTTSNTNTNTNNNNSSSNASSTSNMRRWSELDVAELLATREPPSKLMRVFQLDWLRTLGLALWYHTDADEPLQSVLAKYEQTCLTYPLASPMPGYAQPSRSRSQQSASSSSSRAAVLSQDLRFLLLQLFVDRRNQTSSSSSASLQSELENLQQQILLSPESHTRAPLYWGLCWHLFQLLVGFLQQRADTRGLLELQVEHQLAAWYATQLELEGHWEWALYVLSTAPPSALVESAVQRILSGHIPHCTREQEKFLLERVRLHPAWIEQAKAWLCLQPSSWQTSGAWLSADPHPNSECEVSHWEPTVKHFLQAADWNAAHWCTVQFLAPLTVLHTAASLSTDKRQDMLDNLHSIFSALAKHRQTIADWQQQGQLWLQILQAAQRKPTPIQPPQLPASKLQSFQLPPSEKVHYDLVSPWLMKQVALHYLIEGTTE